MNPPPPVITDAVGSGPDKIYRAGTLIYTKAGLAALFFWLLWGDFCYTVMEAVTGPIMQLKFEHLGASNTEIGLILGTIPNIVYSLLNPVVSFKSDRFRSRWGRRIPFMAAGLPFLVIFMVMLGFGEQVGTWIEAHTGSLLKGTSSNQVIIMTLGVIFVTFVFFNTFATTIFWYLFNDVVPEHLIARFMSWFRLISTASTSLYSFFIFPYSGTHATEIFVGVACLFAVGFGLMCMNVREGDYPPPPPYDHGESGAVAAIKTFAKEAHSFPLYWYMWMFSFLTSMAGGAGMFGLYFSLALGLSMGQLGIINGTVGIVVSVMAIGAGWLADRYHPLRVVLVGIAIGALIVTPSTLIWLFWHPGPSLVFWVTLAIAICLGAPSQALTSMGDPPMLMRLLPRSRYGQFCSTNAFWRAMGGIIGGALAGVYLDFVARFVGKEHAYYYLPFFGLCFNIPGLFLLYKLYQSWKKLGGDADYVAPLPRTELPTGSAA